MGVLQHAERHLIHLVQVGPRAQEGLIEEALLLLQVANLRQVRVSLVRNAQYHEGQHELQRQFVLIHTDKGLHIVQQRHVAEILEPHAQQPQRQALKH